MPTVDADLDKVQTKLHDSGVLWPRAELLRWWNDAYRTMLAQSGAVRRWRPLDVPGRATYAICHEWEDRYTTGTARKFTRAGLGERYQSSALWEAEETAGVTPTASLTAITHEWERSVLSGGVDIHFRFLFPKNHQRVARLEWEGRRLSPITVRELDDTETDWYAQAGEPRWWTTGAGRIRTVELYEITTAYIAAYHLIESDYGLPRAFSGSRTYGVATTTPVGNAYAYATSGDADGLTRDGAPALIRGLGWRFTTNTATAGQSATFTWEVEVLAGATTFTTGATKGTFAWEVEFGAPSVVFGTGTVRAVTSDDRQYWPVASDAQPDVFCGRVADWRSSSDSLLALEVVTPDLDLTEEDTPALIPAPMQKYLRYYVLSRAFGRPGEGRSPVMADHYARRFNRGVAFFQRLGDVARKDRIYQREETTGEDRRRPPRVRLPAEFPRVW